MWTAHHEPLTDSRGTRFTLDLDSRRATVADVMHGWQTDADFRMWFNALLADSSYTAFRWETPTVTTATQSQSFEFVLLDEPSLARSADPHAFAEHFSRATDGVVVFSNLGGDARMIVPCPQAEASAYGHLAAFVRGPETQRHAAVAVGRALAGRISDKPVWLSTASRRALAACPPRRSAQVYGFRPYRTVDGQCASRVA